MLHEHEMDTFLLPRFFLVIDRGLIVFFNHVAVFLSMPMKTLGRGIGAKCCSTFEDLSSFFKLCTFSLRRVLFCFV